MGDMRLLRPSHFLQMFCMTPEVFDKLLGLISSQIAKQTTNFREPISPGEHLAVTLKCHLQQRLAD